jgi:uncharacterized protein YpuA (DUF1002 family)
LNTTRAAWPIWLRLSRLLVLFSLIALITPAFPDVVTATDQVPTVTVGESNTEAQRAEVMDFLEVMNPDQVLTVTVADTVQAMGGVFDMSGIDSAYSSTAVTCGQPGSGISVSTRNIEAIPPELYALALLTADMSDVQLVVAAPSDAPALGMTAMTGVFTTWELAPCSDSGHDPVRRQLALEELALIAGIGEDADAIRQITQIVLDVQQEIIKQPVEPATLDTMLASGFAASGVEINADALTQLSSFLGQLSRAEIDWGSFAQGWSTQPADDGSRVVLIANADETGLVRGDGTAGLTEVVVTDETGVGGTTGPIAMAPSPTAPAPTPVVEPTPVTMTTISTPESTPESGNDAPAGIMGTVTDDDGSRWLQWWPVVAIPLTILLAWLLWYVLLVVQQLRQRSPRRYVSRVRVSRPKHVMRRSVTARPSRRTRTPRMRHESLQS